MRRVLACIPLLLCLPAAMCGERPQVGFPKPPADKLVCPDEPAAPPANGPTGRVTDDDAGAYMKSLRGSWQGCRADVDWLRDWFGKLPK
ncbi:hypothetical protein [Sphingomonas phage Carli]|nr:hypothetical protein [Sphingomonas phage Carli]